MTAVEVYAERSGVPGAPVLVLSGALGSDRTMWDAVLPAFEQHFDVIRYDHRGHGRSPVPDGPYEIADLGEDLLALLDRSDVERAHLLGLSLGGMVGMWVANRAPERLARLVLCCTSAHTGQVEMWIERAAKVLADGTESLGDAMMTRWFSSTFVAEHPDVVGRIREMFIATPASGYADCCGAIERMDQRDQLHRISVPTLVIAGSEDPATPVEHGRLLAEWIPDARLAVVSGAAHFAAVERPDLVAQLVTEFLEG